ncbi:MAG TPA: SDR family oxidoreductase [Gemmatimonadaceae bacterium]|nr:SDR family oxidoreductase [Gemmatimonadaceae bacterium]
MRFRDRVIVLTGVGREGQVGEAVAQAFAAEGARLVLVDRDAAVEARAEALRGVAGAVTAHAADLTDAAQVEALATRVGAVSAGRVHALVHVAGGFALSGPVAEADVGLLPRQLAINLTTAYLATRYFLPLLRPARGALVYFASEAVLPGATGATLSAYAAAKAGVVAVMRAVAEEERGRGVRANAIAPPAIRTRDNIAAMGADARYIEREAVADVVTWLCSEQARAVSGELIRLTA